MSAYGALHAHITTSTSTAVKSTSGTLYGLTINTGQAGASITVYDGTTAAGAVIGIYSATAQGAVTMPGPGAAIVTGIYVVTAGATPADVTVFYA